MRPVLGVEHGDQFAAGEGETVGECPRLGAGLARWTYGEGKALPGLQGTLDRHYGGCVVCLEKQPDVQPFARVVEPFDRRDETRHHVGLVIECDQNAVDG